VPASKSGQIKDDGVSQPIDKTSVDVVKVGGNGKLEVIAEEPEETFAKIDCDKFGKPIDPNFSSRDKIPELYQTDEEGKIVAYDKLKPRKSTIFGLVPAKLSGELKDDTLRQPVDKTDVEVVKVGDDGKLEPHQ